MRFDSIFPKQMVKLLLGLMLAFAPALSQHAVAQSPDVAMMPEKGENIGELRRGELLVTSLKREKVESGSVTLAMQSLRQLFDTRLCRAGDKYLYRLGSGRKLVMLRYQRGQHVYETTLNPETNTYETRLLDIPEQLPPIPAFAEPAPGIDPQLDDGEMDVEHVALNPNAVAETDNDPAQNSLNALNQMDVAQADDPVLPVDSALADKISPDDELPERPGFAPEDDDLEPGPAMDEDTVPAAFAQDRELREEELREDYGDVADIQKTPQPQQVLPDVSTPIIEPNLPVIKPQLRESTTFSTISIVMFVIGCNLFLIACLMFVVPAVGGRLRCRKLGLRIRDALRIAPGMQLLRVRSDGHDCIIAVYPDNMSFIAPCPPDDEKLWQHIQAKSYWYKMAQNPISDRQLRAIVQAFYSDNQELPENAEKLRSSALPDKYDTADLKVTEMPTARAVPDLSDFDEVE